MSPNAFEPAAPRFPFSAFASFILNQEESRINCILSCPLTDIPYSIPPMGDRWQRIAAIFKETHCLSRCCLRGGTAAPHSNTFFPGSLSKSAPELHVCVECRAVTGRESPVCLLEICHYLLTINPQEPQSVTVSVWRNLNWGVSMGRQDEDRAHEGRWHTPH